MRIDMEKKGFEAHKTASDSDVAGSEGGSDDLEKVATTPSREHSIHEHESSLSQPWRYSASYVYMKGKDPKKPNAKKPGDENEHYSQKFENGGQIGPPNDRDREVDYPILRNRLQRLAQWQQAYTYGQFSNGKLTVQSKRLDRPFRVHLTETGNVKQQVEDVTLDMLLWSKHPTQSFISRIYNSFGRQRRGKEDYHVDGLDLQFCEVDANEVGGERLLAKLEKVRASPTGMFSRFTKPKQLSHHTSIKFAHATGNVASFVPRGNTPPPNEVAEMPSIEDQPDEPANGFENGSENGSENAAVQVTEDEAKRMVHVGGLTAEMDDEEELASVFSNFGKVVEVNVRRDRQEEGKWPWAVIKYADDDMGRGE